MAQMTGGYAFGLLGSLEVAYDGEPVTIPGRRQLALLAILLLEANRVVPTERIIRGLWDAQPPKTARESVHFFVHKLRDALPRSPQHGPHGVLETHGSGYLLRVEPARIDIVRFQGLVEQAGDARAQGALPTAWARYRAALGLWRGDALVDLAEVPFARRAGGRLEEQRLAAIEGQVQVGLELGRHGELAGELEALVRAHPEREPLHHLLMLALYRSGRQADALAAYQAARARLIDRPGGGPGTGLQQLQRAILDQDPSLDLPAADSESVAGTLSTLSFAAPPVAASAAAQSPPPAPVAPREERRLVTVVAVGPAAAASETDPEDLRVHTAASVARARERIGHYGGVVHDQAMGRLLGVFGADRSHDDDPERAVRSALEVLDGLEQLSGVMRQCAGVATGDVVVARTGPAGDGGPVTVAGDVLNAAVGLQASAAVGTVLVGAGTYRATLRVIDYRPLPQTSDRQTTWLTSWQALAARGRTGAEIHSGQVSPLTERDRELGLLTDLLGRLLREGAPQLLTIISEPGLGKTRLVGELARLADEAPELVGWRLGRVQQHAQGSFSALAEIVKAHADILDTDIPDTARSKIRDAVAGAIRDPDEMAWVTRQLQVLLTPEASVPDHGNRRPEMVAGWVRFFRAAATKRPLVVVFEDLQWADSALLEFVEDLAEEVSVVPLLVVATARPELLELRRGWGGGKRNAATVSLSPLSHEGTGTLLDALLGGFRVPEDTRELLLASAGGNPLYVEEYVRMLHDAGDVALDRPSDGRLPIPESVQQLIAARLDTLPPVDRLLLQDAAVIGQTFWVGALAAVSQTGRDQTHQALQRLERRGLLRRARIASVAGETEYVFRHALVRDVAYNQILRGERAAGHRRVAAWIEGSATIPDERAEVLAHHYTQALELTRAAGQPTGELAEQTRRVLRVAGDRVGSLGALTAAARLYERALALWPPDEPGRAELLFRLGVARVYGEHAGEADLLAAKAAYAEAGDEAMVADIDLFLGQVAGLRGDGTAMAAYLRRARGGPQGSTLGSVEGALYTAIDLVLADRYQEAAVVAEQATEQATALGQLGVAAAALGVAGQARLDAGDAEGAELLRQAIVAMDTNGHQTVGLARFALAWSLWWFGDLAAAQTALHTHRPAVAGTATAAWMEVLQAGIDYAAGRWDAATGSLDRALTGHDPASLDYAAPFALLQRARIRLGRGDYDGALAAADVAMPLAAAQPGSRQAQLALAVRGRVLLAAGDRPAAASCLDQLLQDQRRNPQAARVTVEQAELVVELGGPAAVLPDGMPPNHWNRAAVALVRCDFAAAVRGYETIGAAVAAATARVRLARQLAAGRPTDARAELDRAVAVFELAGASAFLAHSNAPGTELS